MKLSSHRMKTDVRLDGAQVRHVDAATVQDEAVNKGPSRDRRVILDFLPLGNDLQNGLGLQLEFIEEGKLWA